MLMPVKHDKAYRLQLMPPHWPYNTEFGGGSHKERVRGINLFSFQWNRHLLTSLTNSPWSRVTTSSFNAMQRVTRLLLYSSTIHFSTTPSRTQRSVFPLFGLAVLWWLCCWLAMSSGEEISKIENTSEFQPKSRTETVEYFRRLFSAICDDFKQPWMCLLLCSIKP